MQEEFDNLYINQHLLRFTGTIGLEIIYVFDSSCGLSLLDCSNSFLLHTHC